MFSLKSLLLGVALAAIGSAALIYRTQVWASALIALTLGLVAFAICRALFVPKDRAFWGSFAVFGAMYLAIVSLESLSALHFNLPTTQLITYAMEKLQTPSQTYYDGTTTYAPLIPPGVTTVPTPLTGGSSYLPPYAAPNAATVGMSAMYSRGKLFQIATADKLDDGIAAEARAFLWAAECLWCLLLAFAAGVTCSWLFRPAPQPGENAAAVRA